MKTSIPIIDAHHHIWRAVDCPMISGPMIPRLFGDYSAIQRDYLTEEFKEDVQPSGVVNAIYVKGGWPFEKNVEEAEWVQSEFDRTGWPLGIVAYADFASPDIHSTLQRLVRIPNVKGIRQQLNWHANPAFAYVDRPNVMKDLQWLRGFQEMQKHNLVFELQVFSSQMADSIALVRSFPNVRFVLLHAGMLEDRSQAGWAQWREGLRGLAELSNVYVKLSGLGMFVRRLDKGLVDLIIIECLRLFGPQRCIFGSNFPIEKIWTDYGSLVRAYREPISQLSEVDQRAVLHDNAIRVYDLDAK